MEKAEGIKPNICRRMGFTFLTIAMCLGKQALLSNATLRPHLKTDRRAQEMAW